MSIRVGLISILLFLGSMSQASGETHETCDRYATTAVGQFNEAKESGMNTPFPVWSDDYDHHYQWCLKQSREVIDSEQSARQSQIDKFTRGEGTLDPSKTGIATPNLPAVTPKPGPSTAPKVPAGLVKVRLHVSGYGQYVNADVDCPEGKFPVNWGWENGYSSMWALTSSHQMNRRGWRFKAYVDPWYYVATVQNKNPDGKKFYSFNFYLYCDDIASPPEVSPGPYTNVDADGLDKLLTSKTK